MKPGGLNRSKQFYTFRTQNLVLILKCDKERCLLFKAPGFQTSCDPLGSGADRRPTEGRLTFAFRKLPLCRVPLALLRVTPAPPPPTSPLAIRSSWETCSRHVHPSGEGPAWVQKPRQWPRAVTLPEGDLGARSQDVAALVRLRLARPPMRGLWPHRLCVLGAGGTPR